MDIAEVLERARDVVTVRATIGDPVQQDGMVIVPVTKIRGGGGGGQGHEGTEKEGTGGGFGGTSTPIGAFVIKDGSVTWRPADEIKKNILGGPGGGVAPLPSIPA